MKWSNILSRSFNTQTELHTDSDSGSMTFVEKEDLQPVIDNVKLEREAFNQVGDRVVGQNHMTPIAEIPMIVYNRSVREQWGPKKWRQWLNDPDNKPFRITDGRV